MPQTNKIGGNVLVARLSIEDGSQAETPVESRAARLQKHALGVDAHNDACRLIHRNA
jgi:hypothetical protein